MPKIFISYRRNDSAAHTGRIYDRLEGHFGQGQVFMDVDTIRPGLDFVEVVQEAVGSCDALIAVIGRDWLGASDGSGRRRLDNPEDLVRLEIATALERDIRVIPVLVQGAQMPVAPDLPEGLTALARRNSVEVSDNRFRTEVDQLIKALEAPTSGPADTVFVEPVQLASSTFVGRDREMAGLRTALDGAMAGQGRLVMLAGEPGIGKTRMAQELANQAVALGARVLWGWCYEQEGAPPYWPWVDPVRSYISITEPGRLRSQMGPGAADIGEVIPELREKLPDLEPPPALDPNQARFRLFDSFATFFRNAAQIQPLMLVIDDLHWADKPSLLLLEFLTRRLADSRLLVLGTYRDAEVTQETPLSESLVQLRRSPMFHSRLLGGLESGQVGQFIQAASGGEASQEMIDAIYAHTEGNPFFMSEVIRLLAERGELEEASGTGVPVTLGIPQGVLEVIGQRLNRLSDQCNGALTTVAVAGRQFDFKLLELLNEQTTEIALLELMDEGLEARVIEESTGQRDRYQFSHALMQQTMVERISTSRKVRLHARIAEALEELYGDDAEAHAAELAHHFTEAESVLGTEKLVHYSLLAGERALDAYAHEEALTHFERGLVGRNITLSGTEAASDEEAATLLFGLARAKSATGVGHQLGEAFATLSRAFEYYAEAGNVAQAVAAAEFPIAALTILIPGIAELMARALTLVPADSHEAGRLLSRYGVILGIAEGDYEGAQQALAQAISIARRERDVPLEVQTLSYAALVSGEHLRWQESVDNGLRAIDLATGDETPFSHLVSRYHTATSLLHMGDLDAARPHALVLRDLAERRTTPRLQASNGYVPVISLSCLEGDWKTGRESSDRGLEFSSLNPVLLLPRALLEHQTGESARGEVYLEQLLEAMHQAGPFQLLASARVPIAISVIARITGVPDRLEIAEAAAKAVLSEQSTVLNRAMYAKAGLALLAVQKGDQSTAGEHYAFLLGQRSTMIATVISVDRLLGLLSQTMGSMDQAVAHFEDGLAFCRKAGYRPELAWTCCDYADTLLERNEPGDREKVMFLLDESLAISTELGMRPLMERVISRQDILPV